jgi:hypothetical protein
MNSIKYVCVLVSLVVACGCGGGASKIKITGKVTDKGQPLQVSDKTQVTITFLPEEQKGQTYLAVFDRAKSTYEIELPRGQYRVNILIFGPEKRPTEPGKEVHDLQASRELDLELP